MIVLDIEQGSYEWFEARLGIPTASNFRKLYTYTGKPSASKKTYIYELVAERFSGMSDEQYESAWMGRGSALEMEARRAYEMITDRRVDQVGFCYLDERKAIGCSPDGLVGDNGLIEIKCPKAHNHIRYLLGGKTPAEYYPQVQGQLWITGREWCDFMSYYPGVKPFIFRQLRDDEYIEKLSAEVEGIASAVDDIYSKVKEG